MLKLRELTELAVTALEDVKAIDIRVFDVSEITTIADRMIIATGRSDRHVKSLAQTVIVRAKEAEHPPRGSEGQRVGDWILVDLGDVIVHVMQAQPRAFYQLEKLWDVPPMAASAKSS